MYWYIRMSDFFIEIITSAYNINNEWYDSMDFDVLQTFLPFYKKKKKKKQNPHCLSNDNNIMTTISWLVYTLVRFQ